MRRGRLATVVLATLLTLGAGVYHATPSQACLVPCSATPKALGVVLGGGIPSDFFGYTVYGTFKGVDNGQSVTETFQVSGGGYYPGYGNVTLNGQAFDFAGVTMDVVPGVNGAPSVALITISQGLSSVNLQGHLTGVLNGTSSYGHLEVFS